MLDALFGTDLSWPVKFGLAFAVVLALFLAALWLYRRLGGARIGAAAGRGRQPRLAVIDAASVDARRRLVLIRRDNVEHLVLIGGPTDIVVEQNIVRAVPVAGPREAPPVRPHAEGLPREPSSRPEPAPRGVPMEAAWEPAPAPRAARHVEPTWTQPEPQVRPSRPAEPTWTPQPEPAARPSRHAEPAARVQPPVDLPTRPLPEPVAAALRAASAPEPVRAAPKPALAAPRAPVIEPEQPVEVRQSPPTADVNLADMAQRLEAALRRPAAPRPAESRAEPRVEPRPEPKPRPAPETRPAP
jgi:flagellar protein FliO/FliZ